YDLVYSDGQVLKFNDEKLFKLSLAKDSKGNDLVIVTSDKNNSYQAYIIQSNQVSNKFTLPSLESAKSYSLSDIKNDGNIYFITSYNDKLYSYSLNGSLAENFPFTAPESESFTGLPLAADIEGDTRSEVIFYSSTGK